MSETDLNALSQKTLKQIRALCDGNGVAPDSVQIMEQKPEMVPMEALTHLEIDLKTVEEEKVGKFQKGTFLPTIEAMHAAITEAQTKIIKNDKTRQFIGDKILNRPDKGFALHGEEIDVTELQQDFSCHAPCNTCGGEGSKVCGQCGGHRKEVCTQCHGRTMISCRHCHGAGMIQEQGGNQKQCTFCFGQRQVSCPLCQKTGRMNCRACKASGRIKCDPCKGNGIFTRITAVLPFIKTLFEMDRAELPHAVVGAIERQGSKLAAKGHMSYSADIVSRKDGGMAVQYKTSFPYNEITFRVNGKPVKVETFGERGKIIKMKPFLEDIIAPGLVHLKKAAKNDGMVSGLIKKASHCRIIAKALSLTASSPRKRDAVIALKKKYPIGIQTQSLQHLIKLSDTALGNVTRKPRYMGLSVGLVLSAVLYAGVYLSGAYETLTPYLNNSILDLSFAGLLIAVGGTLTHFMIKIAANKAMRFALGNLIPQANKSKATARTRTSGLYSYLGASILLLLIIEIARHTGAIIPSWYPLK